MKKTAVIFGSTTGTTETVAQLIAEKLGIGSEDVYEVSNMTADVIANYEVLILGTSTWGCGDLQDDWYDGVDVLKGADLSGKTVALFGCGDSCSYSDTFCNAMGEIYNSIKDSGCTFVGAVDTAGYDYDSSDAEVDGHFVGLPIDDMNESDKTDERVTAWTDALKSVIA